MEDDQYEPIDLYQAWINMISSSAGSAAGSMAGGGIGGPLGAAVGGALGSIIQDGVDCVIDTLQNRQKEKVGIALANMIQKIEQYREDGYKVREDIDVKNKNDRKLSEELIEGVFIKSKNEYEEKKLKYLGYFYAYYSFHGDNVKSKASFYLLDLFESLSYRQLCLLRIFGENEDNKFGLIKEDSWIPKDWILLQEIQDLHSKKLIGSEQEGSFPKAESLILIPAKIKCSGIAGNIIKYFSLDEIPQEDINECISLLKK